MLYFQVDLVTLNLGSRFIFAHHFHFQSWRPRRWPVNQGRQQRAGSVDVTAGRREGSGGGGGTNLRADTAWSCV